MRSFRDPASWAGALVTLIWAWMVLKAPTLDFDESLYRSVAASMKKAGDPWLLEWDGKPLFHKPPLFYWMIALASAGIDGARETISSAAARIPSLLCSAGILFGLFRYGGRHSALAFLCALFPVLTGTAVLFDPLQSLLLLPALLIPTQAFETERSVSAREWFIFGMSLAAASAVKGLNGFLIGGGALGLHLTLSLPRYGWRRNSKEGLRALLFGLLPGAVAIGGALKLYDLKMGSAFTEEFLWVQHFNRSQTPMEAHGGNPLYHFGVLFFGGGFLTPLLAATWFRKRPDLIRSGYPLTFALTCALLFSLSATKLPHYTWPAWAALALFTGRTLRLPDQEGKAEGPDRRISFLMASPVFLLGTLALLISIAPGLFLESLPPGPRARDWVAGTLPLPDASRMALLLTALACFSFQTLRRTITRNAGKTALWATVAYGGLSLALVPWADQLMVKPYLAVAQELKTRIRGQASCIHYSGPLSATLSLALAPELKQNGCDHPDYRITPTWKEAECTQGGMKLLQTHPPLLLCGKTPR
jgi:4-amino-4-deoxy-L-arabinose transferase-like glycosyltransferase